MLRGIAVNMRWNVLLIALLASGSFAATVAADDASDQYTVAVRHYQAERWGLAVDEFQVFLKRHHEHPLAGNATYYLGMTHMRLRQYEAARRAFRECLTRRPQGRRAIMAHFRIGEMSYLLRDLEQARRDLTAFRKAHPTDTLNCYALPYLADVALRAKAFGESERLFRQALDRYPNGPEEDACRFGLARALDAQGQREEAGLIYLALAAKVGSPLADQALYSLGKQQLDTGEFAKASETFTALEKDLLDSPFRQQARFGRGCALFRLKKYDRAQPLFESLIDEPQLGMDASSWLGATLKAQGRWREAAATLLAAYERKPEHALAAEILFHAGDALRMAGLHDDAGKQFDKVIGRWPQHKLAAAALLGKLRVASASKDHVEIDALARHIATDHADSPEHAEAQRRLGWSLIGRGRAEQGAELLEGLLADTTNEAHRLEILQLLAAAHLKLENHQRVVDIAKQAEGLAGSDEQNGRIQMAKGRSLAALKQWHEAIAVFTQAAAAASPEQGLRRLEELAVCYANTGQVKEALQTIDKLAADHGAEPAVSTATLRLAETLYRRGQFPEAANLYAKLAHQPRHKKFAAEGVSGQGWSQFKAGLLGPAAETFAKLLNDYPDHDLAAEAALARAQVLEQLNDPDGAAVAYRRVIEHYADGKEYAAALLSAANLHGDRKQPGQAAELYQRLLEECPGHEQAETVRYQLAWALHDSGQAGEAERVFGLIHRDYPGSRFWADATYRLADAAFAGGRHAEAGQLLDELLAAEPAGEILAHALFLQGRVATTTEDWAAAAEPLERLVKEFPDSPLRLLAEYWQAEATYQQGKYADAAARLGQLAPRVEGRDETWAGMVPLRQAQALAHLKQWPEAQAIAEKIADEHPNFDAQYEADYVLGRCLANQALFHEARQAYRRVTKSDQGGKTETAAMAQWMIGETYFHQKVYRSALREYLRVEILYAYPKWQAAALLQAGKCCEHLGHLNLAKGMYERVIGEFAETEFKHDAQERLRLVTERKQREDGKR